MEAFQYFKRSFYLRDSSSTIPSACSYSSLSDSLHFSIFLTPRSLVLFKEWQSIFAPPHLLYCCIFLLSTPWDLDGRISIFWACARGQLLCPGFTHISSLIPHNRQLEEAFLSPPGRWEMKAPEAKGPDWLKGTPVDCGELVDIHADADGWSWRTNAFALGLCRTDSSLWSSCPGQRAICPLNWGEWVIRQCHWVSSYWGIFPGFRYQPVLAPSSMLRGHSPPESGWWPTQATCLAIGEECNYVALNTVSSVHFLLI
jgi:hypothetical protein